MTRSSTIGHDAVAEAERQRALVSALRKAERLQAINAELVAALRELDGAVSRAMIGTPAMALALERARAALAKATKP